MRSQRHARSTLGSDSTESDRYPGTGYDFDWPNTWPSGSGKGAGKYAENGLVPPLILDYTNDKYWTLGLLGADPVNYGTLGAATLVDATGTLVWNVQDLNGVWIPISGTLPGSPVYLPRIGHHLWDGAAWVNSGLLTEPVARTNLLLNSGALGTQTVTGTTVDTYTLHFTGTGSVTLSGAGAGTLNGTLDGEEGRVLLTFASTGGSVVCTVSGTVTNAQLELSATATSYIPTAGATASRIADPAPILTFDNISLGAIRILTANAVDVKVYDTRLDSDGGAWRASATTQSWYTEPLNTATRGARQDFPQLALIVAEADRVVIYDGDSTDLNMWMVFLEDIDNMMGSVIGTSGHKLAALNGNLVIGSPQNDVKVVNFISDGAYRRGTSGVAVDYALDISTRNDLKAWLGATTPNIASRAVSDVAMLILPGAPIDGVTGLPIPTIAVTTAGNGTYSSSILQDDGVIYDIADDSVGTAVSVSVLGTRLTVVRSDGEAYIWDDAGTIATDGTAPDKTYNSASVPALLGDVTITEEATSFGSTLGITLLDPDLAVQANSMVSYISNSYSTGWMVGDIKGAWLSDTDVSALVGGDPTLLPITATTGFALTLVSAGGHAWTLEAAEETGGGPSSSSAYVSFGALAEQTVVLHSNSVVTEFRSNSGNLGFDLASLPAGLLLLDVKGSNTTFGDVADLPAGLESYVNIGSNVVTGDVANIPNTVFYFRTRGSNALTGDIANLPAGLVNFDCEGSNTLTGDVANLPANLNVFSVIGSNTISGDIGNLPAGITQYSTFGSNTTTGDIGNLPAGIVYCRVSGNNTCTMVNAWSAATVNFRQLVLTGSQSLSATVVDKILFEVDTKVVSWTNERLINVSGNNAAPTGGASNANVLSLQGKGVTVVHN